MHMLNVLPCLTHGYFLSCLWGYVFSSVLGMIMGPIPSLTFPIDQINLKTLKFQFDDRTMQEMNSNSLIGPDFLPP